MNDHVAPADDTNDEPSTAIAEYTETERGLAELRHRLSGRAYDVTTTKGLDEARKDRTQLRGLRVGLDKLRKQLNEDDQARINMRNAKAKEITAQIVELEDPIDQQIKKEEARKEQARIERERAEAERLRKINDEIANIERMPLDFLNANAKELSDAVEALAGDTLEDFDEVHLPTAQAAKDASLTKLREMLDARVAADAEAERLAAERAELDRIRASEEEQRRQREAEDAARREQEEAERLERQAAEDRARAEQAEADRIERERVAAEQAERQRQLDEQAEAQRRAQEEAEARARAEQEQRDAEERERIAREQAEAAERARQQEEDAIQRATLREAAQEAHDMLVDMGHADHITTRKLEAALAKEPSNG